MDNVSIISVIVVVVAIFGTLVMLVSAQSNISPPVMDEGRETPYFPTVSGSNIDGVTFTLPEAFTGNYNVVMLAFDQVHQRLVETWVPSLRQLEDDNLLIRIYEVPTLPEYDPITRWSTDMWMSAGISGSLTRETTITLYTNVDLMQEAIGFENTETLSVILVDPEGNIYWHSSGEYSDTQFTTLMAVLDTLQDDAS